ncbi:YggT family protein [Thiohalomonas denitrificans]|uniref:YggT family protein n=1 Tax=Thiohalomonas denitrificans TaxID=415747 RepID=A0A1G5QJY8_9GAMM|nr:YggT family protein [Thiohalomonas denitrificans]SCZ61916.1 YggT family protein [Thiohalomonas denitrificans]
MNGYLTTPLQFLIGTLFSLYVLAILLRFLLQQLQADFYNPVSQFLVKITNPPLRPLRRLIPGIGGIDVASLVLMFLIQLLAVALVGARVGAGYLPGLIATGAIQPVGTLIGLTIVELVDLAFNVFIFAVIIQAVLSWVNPGAYSPVSSILHSLTEPVLRPVRRFIPPMSGLDLSPLVAILGLQVLKMLVLPPVRQLALGG